MPDQPPPGTVPGAQPPPGNPWGAEPWQGGWLMSRLRAHDRDWTDLRRQHADRMGLHPTDAYALYEIALHDRQNQPLTATQLSDRLRLSPAATSALLNRLEKGGHIHRGREHDDQRVVTLRATDASKRRAEDSFAPANAVIQQMTDRYPPALRQQIEAFFDDLHATLQTALAADHATEAAASPADHSR